MASVVLTGNLDLGVDFDAICVELSKESGCKVWWERDRNKVNVLTDGNPNRVRRAAAAIIYESLFGDSGRNYLGRT